MQGGVTPSLGDIETTVSALARSGTGVNVLIRPRPGNFVYSTAEKQVWRMFYLEKSFPNRDLNYCLPLASEP